MTATTSTAIAVAERLFTGQEELALAGFLAGYTGLTREAHALDLRQYRQLVPAEPPATVPGRRADIEALGVERGHRTLVITRKGGKVVTIPLAPRTARGD